MTLGINLNNELRAADDPEFGLDALTLFVEWIAMDYDNRPRHQRPRPRDVFVALWVHVCRRPLLLLRRFYFQTVIESGTRAIVRDLVCPLLGIAWVTATNSPAQQFTLVQPGRSGRPGNDGAFEELCTQSALVKVVASIPGRYPEMMQPGCALTIAEIVITPSFTNLGEQGAFDMEIVLEDGDASDSSE